MLRTKHIASRLLLLVLFATFLVLAVDPLVTWAIARAGRGVTGARLSIASVQTSWKKNTVQLRDIRAVDPERSNRNIFAADLINMELDRVALCRRKIRVVRAQVSGLEIGAERRAPSISQHAQDNDYSQVLAERFLTNGGLWLESAGEELSKQHLGSSSTVDTLLGVLERVPSEFDALEEKTTNISGRIQELNSILSDIGDNPLRNATSYQEAISELDTLNLALDEVRRSADQLQQQIVMDRESIASAQATDLETMEGQLDVAQLDSEHLTEYLLGPEVADRVATLAQWVRWGRGYLPSLHAKTPMLRHRGVNVSLLDSDPEPDILLETVVLSGHAQVGKSRLQVEGSVSGLSSHPRFQKRPAEVVVQTTGGAQLLIQASFQGVANNAVDKIVVNSPNMELPQRTLGDSDQLALQVDPASAHYWVELNIEGDRLNGEMVIKQQAATLQPIMGAELQRTPVAGLVSEAAGRIVAIDSSIRLSGTLDHPEWQLRSNLGHELAQNLQNGLRSQLVSLRKNARHRIHDEATIKIAKLDTALNDRYQRLSQQIEAAGSTIHQVTKHVAQRVDESGTILNQSSPLRETLRR